DQLETLQRPQPSRCSTVGRRTWLCFSLGSPLTKIYGSWRLRNCVLAWKLLKYISTEKDTKALPLRLQLQQPRNLSSTQLPLAHSALAALQALKRKKRFEKQLTQIDGTLSTIEFQREALENSHTNTEVLRNMGFAAKAMKAVHENMDLNKIDDLMQDITEQQDIAQEISEAFSQRVQFADGFDEDELLAELEELEQEELNKKMTSMELPNVPSSSLPAQPSRKAGVPSSVHRSRAASSRRAEEDDDFKQLAAWAT
uniref:Charged multivesicular body protein 4C n=2 Tax=Rattus norvegicus TaxID=10116 RepID=A0ABK0L8G6_RAT